MVNNAYGAIECSSPSAKVLEIKPLENSVFSRGFEFCEAVKRCEKLCAIHTQDTRKTHDISNNIDGIQQFLDLKMRIDAFGKGHCSGMTNDSFDNGRIYVFLGEH